MIDDGEKIYILSKQLGLRAYFVWPHLDRISRWETIVEKLVLIMLGTIRIRYACGYCRTRVYFSSEYKLLSGGQWPKFGLHSNCKKLMIFRRELIPGESNTSCYIDTEVLNRTTGG